jgi:hypothetical protein
VTSTWHLDAQPVSSCICRFAEVTSNTAPPRLPWYRTHSSPGRHLGTPNPQYRVEINPVVPSQAALGVNTSLFTLSFVVFNFLATATTPAVASAVGSRNSTAAGEVVYQATALAVLLGLAVAAGLYTNASWLLSVMGADPSQGEHMHDLAMQYLMIRCGCSWGRAFGGFRGSLPDGRDAAAARA